MNEREELMQSTAHALNDIYVSGNTDNMELGTQGLTVLIGGALCDLRRIAAAVERLANHELRPPAFTREEIETIEALRRGDIVTVKTAPPSMTIDDLERLAIQAYRDSGTAAMVKDKDGAPHLETWAELSMEKRKYWRDQIKG